MLRAQALALTYGKIIHATGYMNADGTCQRWRVNGMVKTWKRDANRFEIPLKHGLRTYGYLNQDNMGAFHLAEECENQS